MSIPKIDGQENVQSMPRPGSIWNVRDSTTPFYVRKDIYCPACNEPAPQIPDPFPMYINVSTAQIPQSLVSDVTGWSMLLFPLPRRADGLDMLGEAHFHCPSCAKRLAEAAAHLRDYPPARKGGVKW